VDAEPVSFGTWLRRQREMRGVELRDIAERTKISLRYLEAMEDDRFDLLPAPVFAKGFLREYARYVGLSPDEVVNHWLSVQPAGEEERGADVAPGKGRALRPELARGAGRSWLPRVLVLLGVLLVLGLLAGAVWYALHLRRAPARDVPAPTAPRSGARLRSGPPAAPAAASPRAAALSASVGSPAAGLAPVEVGRAPAATAATAAQRAGEPAPSGEPMPLEVSLDFTRDCWVEVTVDGKKVLSEERVPGEALQLQARDKVVLTLGNPSAVEAQVNGYAFDLPGGRRPVHDLVIDLDTVRALKAKPGAP
jgi:cytoskeleton protein RodZ